MRQDGTQFNATTPVFLANWRSLETFGLLCMTTMLIRYLRRTLRFV